jgi:hypothetical protein
MINHLTAGGVTPGDGRRQFAKSCMDALVTHLDTTLQLDDDIFKRTVLHSVYELLRNFPGFIPDTPNEFASKLATSTWEVLQSEVANLNLALQFSGSLSAAEVFKSIGFGVALTKRWSEDGLLPVHQPRITDDPLPLQQPRIPVPPPQVYIFIYK